MPLSFTLKDFLRQPGTTLDVRSPNEFLQGHIPESHSFALFSDAERAQIGTVYKQQSKQEAIELGLLLVEPKIEHMLNQVPSLLNSHGKIVCWRGGMRSGFMAHLLEWRGYSVITLQGGYQAYRRWALQQFHHLSLSSLCVLGGLTGSGKTDILQALKQRGEQVIDLEALAKHRGSVFGELGPQPTQEQFENELAMTLEHLDRSKPIWIEDESRVIGHCHLPTGLYQSIKHAPLFYIQRSLSERLTLLLAQYGQTPKEQLLTAVNRITKRLGNQLAKEVQQLIEREQNEQAFERLLTYYDKAYQYHLTKRQMTYCIQESSALSSDEWADMLQAYRRRI